MTGIIVTIRRGLVQLAWLLGGVLTFAATLAMTTPTRWMQPQVGALAKSVLVAALIAVAIYDWRTRRVPPEISWPFFVAGVGVGLSRWLFVQDSCSVPYWIGLYVLAQSQLIGGGDAKLLFGAFGLWPETAFFVALVGVFVGWGFVYVVWRYREQVITRLGARLGDFVRSHGNAAGQPRQAATWAVALVIGGWLLVI